MMDTSLKSWYQYNHISRWWIYLVIAVLLSVFKLLFYSPNLGENIWLHQQSTATTNVIVFIFENP